MIKTIDKKSDKPYKLWNITSFYLNYKAKNYNSLPHLAQYLSSDSFI